MKDCIKAAFLVFATSVLLHGCGRDAPSDTTTEIKTESGIDMVLVSGGWFAMGDQKGDIDEIPHNVYISSFYIDKYPVTQEEYQRVMGKNPSRWKGEKNPVEQIRWSDAVRYCNARSRAEGLRPCYNLETWECNFNSNGYRLPTEAEWEYACRAGTKTRYFFGNGRSKLRDYGWCKENSGGKPRPVGEKPPNPWGLYDMCGNVWEWCNDFYKVDYYEESPKENPNGPKTGETKVVRGGCWNSTADKCRSSFRYNENPGYTDACFGYDIYGFRCVRAGPEMRRERREVGSKKLERRETDQNSSAERGELRKNRSQERGKTGFLYDDIYLQHKTGAGHPERPQRLVAIVQGLQKTGLLSRLVRLGASPASQEWLAMVHTPEYVERVRRSCEEGGGYMDSMDTVVSRESYKVAVAAVGGVLSAIDAVMEGKVRNAFCAIRPPGHHALRDKAMGFCLFNNIAIAAKYIQKRHELAKVLIVDWDVHHGNGTQETFYDDPAVLYFGVHRYPFYPGTGSAAEKGAGKGLGYNINVPLPAGSGDKEFQRAFREELVPAALEFHPDFILISAGFDAHEDDPLGGMKVTAKAYGELTRIVKELADKCCKGRVVSILEGGYSLEGLADSVEAHIRALME